MIHHFLGDHSIVPHQTIDGTVPHLEGEKKSAHQQYGDGQFGVQLENEIGHIDVLELVGGLKEEGGLVVFDCSYRIPYCLDR